MTSKLPLVYAVLVHYHSVFDTIECINSLLDQIYNNLKILVVDNASTDNGSIEIEKNFPQIEIIVNQINLGATGGYNTAIKRALEHNAQYIYLVNNDTISDPETIYYLVQAMELKKFDIISPIIYYYSKPQKIWSAGGAICPLTLDMIDNHGRNKVFKEISQRDILTTCAIMFNRKVLKNVGLFDESYFCYYDDADYSFRARKAGYKLAVEPKSKVWHKVSISSGGTDSSFERFWMGRGSILYIKKHAKFWQWIFIFPWRLMSLIKTVTRLIYYRKYNSAIAYLKGIWVGIIFQFKETRYTNIQNI